MVSLVHVVDELDALAPILEGRIREGGPAVVLTLTILVAVSIT